MNIHEEYTQRNSYYSFQRGNGIWQADKEPRVEHYYGEEVRDKEYYANRYADTFRRIVSMIERGELQFRSSKDRSEAWHAACKAMCRYRERAERYEFIRKHGREMTEEEYLYKHGYTRSA